MRKLLIFILQFLPFCGFAQNGFQRVFLQVPSAVDAETCTRSIKLANGNIASIGFNDGCAPCATTFYFRLSDPYGNEIRHTTYGAGVEWIWPEMVSSTDGNLLCMIGKVEYPSGSPTDVEYDLQFLKLDTSGTLITSKNFNLRVNNFFTDVLQLYSTSDSGCVLTTTEHFMKLNSALDSVVFFHPNRLSYSFRSFTEDLFGFFTSDSVGGMARAFIKYYDSNFDSVKVIFFDSTSLHQIFPPGWARTDFKEDYQGSLYVTLTSDNFDSVAIMKFDSLLHQQWCRYIVSDFAVSGQIGLDSEYVLFAGTISHITPANYVGHNYVYRLNLNGDSLSYREFISAGSYPYSQIYDAKSYNGSYLLSGYAKSDTSYQKSFICSVDTSLNIPVGIKEQQFTPDIIIYPQPAIDVVKVLSDMDITNIFIMDMLGKQILEINKINKSSFEINTAGLKAGIYCLKIKLKDSKVVLRKIEIL